VIVVLDANTLAPMAVAPTGGVLATILDAWRQGRFVVILSDHLLEEAERTLANRYFSARLAPEDVRVYMGFVRTAGRRIEVTVEVVGVATHPEDDLVLATAVSAGAEYLVTGDVRFRTRVPAYRGVRLVSPAEFLDVLRRDADDAT
jgi:uncharacterized protein